MKMRWFDPYCYTSDDGGHTVMEGKHNFDKNGFCRYCGMKDFDPYKENEIDSELETE